MKTRLDDQNGQRRPGTRHSLLLCWLPLLLVVAWAGCKQQVKGSAEINPVGVYALISVDGKTVPSTLTHEGNTATLKSGAFTVNADGTCSSKMTFSIPGRGDGSREVKATYTQQGPTLTMKWQGAGVTTGTIAGSTFTMNNEGTVFAYSK